jgi:superfamily II DNA or RNA helicase
MPQADAATAASPAAPAANGNGARPPITHKMLVDWAGAQAVRDAEAILSKGLVLQAEYEPPRVKGIILWNNRELHTALRMLPDGTVDNECPCYASKERAVICAHAIAVGLTLVRRHADPLREQKHQEEMRRATRLAAIPEKEYIRRVPVGSPGSVAAELRITLPADWTMQAPTGRVRLVCEAVYQQHAVPLDQVPRDIPLSFSQRDEALLFVLEDIAEGPARGVLDAKLSDFLNIVGLNAGRTIACADGEPVEVHETRLRTQVQMDLSPGSGELILSAATELPFRKEGERAVHVASGREVWAYGADHLWPLENVLPGPYQGLYDGPISIPRQNVLRFLQHELPVIQRSAAIVTDLTLDLFTIEPARPRFRLIVRGSLASVSGTASALYGDLELALVKPDPRGQFAIPDPEDLLRYTVRNLDAERAALRILAGIGLAGEVGDSLGSLMGRRDVLNFLGSRIPALRRAGWRVDMEGRIGPVLDSSDFVTPVVHIHEEGERWFDVSFEFEDAAGASISNSDVQLALRRGESFIERGDRVMLIDSDAVTSMQDVFSDCAVADGDARGHFRMASVYGAFVKSSLDALDGIDVESTSAWRQSVAKANRDREMRVESVPVAPPLAGILRPYQLEGVNWLWFLESNGFCGILADEMGLGKTLQTLTWLRETHNKNRHDGKPALIVCPTSIVENWAQEATRYVPELKVMAVTGADRHAKWTDIGTTDIVITSYALLKRDIERYVETEFSAAILDEAQHIKNRSTQNAQAAKRIRARHRLVLTGTPIENSVADLWSIMDYLMPGYLGSHETFRTHYEMPIGRGGQDAEVAQARLRRKLHPFLLRRVRTEVAKDLPPRIEKISPCALSPDQQLVYAEVLNASRRRLQDMVAKQGFNRCRMEVLSTLMRLRQICCHLDLLKLPDLQPKFPSAKMDLFFELLDEALDGNHRVLVFSQFVSMLQILRQNLDQRELQYCYLDGATKDRMDVVHRFNSKRDIPVFLISLKAGGTGLNLTGADVVIHYDPWWNPAVENQATDRAYRIGQKRTVYSIKLITQNTVEEKVLALQARKQSIINATMQSDEKMLQSLTWEDIQELLA